MAQISLSERDELVREFRIMRANAIQAYSHLESSLCGLFGHLAGVTDQVAGIIFFKMVNARSRIATLERLKRVKYGTERNLFFNSLMAATQALDGERNKVVHWQETIDRAGYYDSTKDIRVILHRPNFSDSSPDDTVIDVAGMERFRDKCLVYGYGALFLRIDWMGRGQKSLRGIFEQPLPYPLPEDHPLAQLLQALDDRDQSLRESP